MSLGAAETAENSNTVQEVVRTQGPGGPEAELQFCKDEPIRTPGSVQAHGFLLLVDAQDKLVVAASENAETFLDIPLRLILGAPIDTLLERETLLALTALAISGEAVGVRTYLGSFKMRSDLYSVVTHKVGNERILEFERIDRLVSSELTNAVITNFVGKLSTLTNEVELCQAITKQVKDLTGYNRVLLYRFDEVGHGTVLAEDNDGTLPSYLDLRFPASDIPQQARELYVANTIRIIPDVDYEPSPLRALGNRPIAVLDLSMAQLRSISPFHVVYMRNMGTVSSMSISIVCEGKLWGLISAHHTEPRTIPYLVRSACDLLTKVVGTQLTGFRTASKLGKMVDFHGVQRRILTEMAAENDYLGAMVAQIASLARVVDADGVALILDGQCTTAGQTPGHDALLHLADWMGVRPGVKLFESRHLSADIEGTEGISDLASGMLAVRISDVRESYLMWFRPEVVRTVTWAGSLTDAEESKSSLDPRNSFAAWKEQVRGQSVPWTEMEIESARDFRASVITISLKRAEEAVELSESRFQQLTHALPNLVWTSDDQGELTYVNGKWTEQGLIANGKWYAQKRLSGEDQDRCRESWQQAVRTGMPFEAEVRFRRGGDDSEERWNLVQAVPFRRSKGERAGWVGTFTDLTDRRAREMAVGMTEKLALTGRMTSVIAHEINNPLEAVTNLLYLLQQEVDGNPPAQEYIRMAEGELARISGITKQTLRWSRESVQNVGQGNVGAVFDDVLRLYAGKIRNREVRVEVTGGREIGFMGVLGQIQQVVANLLANAVDAVPVGGKVWLGATQSAGMAEIVVRDEGAGMTEEVRKHLFQPFYSTKGDLGNGLGLYISKEIVERHGGQLTVESDVDVGTTVRMRLVLPAAAGLGERVTGEQYS